MRALVVNAGSSTLKLSVLDDDGNANTVVASRTLEGWEGDSGPIRAFVTEAGTVDAVGHRVVHGGTRFTDAVVIDDTVLTQLQGLAALAPLHQPRTLTAIDAAQRALPTLDHVACFDTAFHATMSPAAYTYALPAEWRAQWPLRRFGFPGLSHAYASRRAAALARQPLADLRIVSCHLGAGASLCAIEGGRSVDTTMGFTPLDGLVMATRSGSIDPGLMLWLMEEHDMSPKVLGEALEHESGLRGLAGTDDMRAVITRRAQGDAAAALAFDVYAHALRRSLGAMAAVLLAVDVFVFTGGVGEHAPEVRAACGIPLDTAANAATRSDGEISATGTDLRTFVVTAREDVEIVRQMRGLLDGRAPDAE
jgi:acetate kinase